MSKSLTATVERVNNAIQSSGDTVFAFFSKCYVDVFKKTCASSTVAIDTERWNRAVNMGHGPIVPYYVSRYFEKIDEEQRRIDRRATAVYRWQGNYHRGTSQHLRMVSEPENILQAHRCRDGVWRT